MGHALKGTPSYYRELEKSREWKKNNKKRNQEIFRNWKKNNKHKVKEYRDKAPWANHCYGAKTRCTMPSHDYFKRGIKFLMTIEDFKYLWFRDEAFTMETPSIDRINPDGNYELSNCRFIELDDNRRLSRGNRKQFHCDVEGCNNPHVSKGLCSTHYQRRWRDGQ